MLTEVGIVGRSVVYGAAAGAVIGGLFGFVLAPVIGAAFGAPIGAVVGIGLGLVNAIALSIASLFLIGDAAARVVAGVVSALSALTLTMSVEAGAPVVAHVLLATVSGTAGALLGPIALRGYLVTQVAGARHVGWTPRTLRLGATVLAVTVGVGASAGAVWGVLAGRDYPPTVGFAMLEGATIGGAGAFAVAAFAALLGGAVHVLTSCLQRAR